MNRRVRGGDEEGRSMSKKEGGGIINMGGGGYEYAHLDQAYIVAYAR